MDLEGKAPPMGTLDHPPNLQGCHICDESWIVHEIRSRARSSNSSDSVRLYVCVDRQLKKQCLEKSADAACMHIAVAAQDHHQHQGG